MLVSVYLLPLRCFQILPLAPILDQDIETCPIQNSTGHSRIPSCLFPYLTSIDEVKEVEVGLKMLFLGLNFSHPSFR